MEGPQKGLGFRVQLITLGVCKVGWCGFFGVVFVMVVMLLLLEARGRVNAEVGVADGEQVRV